MSVYKQNSPLYYCNSWRERKATAHLDSNY